MNEILNSVQQAALNRLEIKSLNTMQVAALEHCRKNGSMVLLSPTGTGKTLAFLLPLLERLNSTCNSVQAVIVLPSRELAKQVFEVWRAMATPFQMIALYGGRPLEQEVASFSGASPSVIVGTPGRLLDHLNRSTFAVDKCTHLIIDEFDKCLEMGFQEEMSKLVEKLPAVSSRFLLSATDAAEIPQFAGAAEIEKLDYRQGGEQPSVRTSFYTITTTPDKRLEKLFSLLCSFGGEPAIVFCNFRDTVDEVYKYLTKASLQCVAYNGAMEQKARELALYRFTAGCSNILVSTDLAARGLDIKDVKHVIHYQRALSADIFTHRNGRTARWEADGAVYMMTFENKELPEFVPAELQEYTLPKRNTLPPAPEWTALYVGKGKRDKISRGDLAGFFIKKGGLKPEDVGTILVFDNYAYVAVKLKQMRALLKKVEGEKIKGIKTLVMPARCK
ncbi:MAG: DEAD/DEAH box helicase [Bacteroidaceae bacterium]|nr:DEAD/DEAH box helicase [Bacteroidaceae bacterium]